MIGQAIYVVELYLNGKLIGNVRDIAESLTWSRKRTRIGVDTIGFTVNDRLFAKWCETRGVTINDMLAPIALTCRIVRNGVPLVGGFLATMPAYEANGTSASLSLSFDGYMNLLANVYYDPASTAHAPMGEMVAAWINGAEVRSKNYGKAFGFKRGSIAVLPAVTETFGSWKSVKDLITDRCDNTTGAGPFEVYFHPDLTYDVIKEADFGEEITDYVVQYPAQLNGVSALELSAPEISNFASAITAVGSDETGITSFIVDREAVAKYGYAETVYQQSSVSDQETLERNANAELRNISSLEWQPQIKLSGKQVAPVPTGPKKIWLGDTIMLQNNAGLIGMTSGRFRVNSLEVSIDANGAEEITPTLSRSEAINTSSFIKDFVRMRNNLLAVGSSKTARSMVE